MNISPISFLPAEILSKIFLENCKAYRENSESTLKNARNPQRYRDKGCLVSLVCRRWRFTALDYSEMWSHIIVLDYSLEQLRQYLTRSKTSELTVLFTFRRDLFSSEDATETYNTSAVECLQPHMHRITVLSLFDVSRLSVVGHVVTFLHAATGLKSLRLSKDSIDKKSRVQWIQDIELIHYSSALSKLILQGIRPALQLFRVETVCHLTLNNIDMSIDYLQMLLEMVAHSLVTLSISKVNVEWDAVIREQRICFTRLAELHLDAESNNYIQISKLFSIKAGLSVSYDMRFSVRYYELIELNLEEYFSAMELDHEEIRMSIDLLKNNVLISSRNYEGMIRLNWDAEGAYVGQLCKEVYRHIHRAVQMQSLKSLHITFHGVGTSFYDTNLIRLSTNSLSHFNVLSELQNLLLEAGSLQRLQISLNASSVRDREKEYFADFQDDLITVLQKVQEGTVRNSGEKGFLELRDVVLRGFFFGGRKNFVDSLERFLMERKNDDCILRIDEAHSLADETLLKLSCIAPTLYIDGELQAAENGSGLRNLF